MDKALLGLLHASVAENENSLHGPDWGILRVRNSVFSAQLL